MSQGGDLSFTLFSNAVLPWGLRVKLANDIISGLQYLHMHNVIHRDIKSANILLDDNWNCKVVLVLVHKLTLIIKF